MPDTVTLFLLMGVDARPGEAIDIGVRPDSLSVAAYDSATNSCRLLSIQRDSRVELPGYGMSKINHALAVGGIPYEKLVVEQFLGIPIDHYALIDFTGVTAVHPTGTVGTTCGSATPRPGDGRTTCQRGSVPPNGNVLSGVQSGEPCCQAR